MTGHGGQPQRTNADQAHAARRRAIARHGHSHKYQAMSSSQKNLRRQRLSACRHRRDSARATEVFGFPLGGQISLD